MADGVNTRTTLEGLYKIVYPKGVENAIPDQTMLLGEMEFEQIGETYKHPVCLTLPGGMTFGGVNDTSTGGTAYALAEAIASESKKLNVEGYQYTLREVIGYGAAKAAKGGPECFKKALSHVFDGMALSAQRHIEMTLLDGQSGSGQGVVETAGAVSGDIYYITLTAASWAPGRFLACKGHGLNVFDRTTSEPNSTERVGTTQSVAIINSVDFATRKITYTLAGGLISVAADDVVFWGNNDAASPLTASTNGEWTGTAWNVCMGMIDAAKTTGTVWGQDNTAYELIRGETQSAGSTDLSFDVCGDAAARLWFKGATGTARMLVSGTTWNNLISPEVAVRRHDSNYKPEKVKVGHDKIEFHHLTGTLEIVPHAFMKEGEALIYFPKLWKRVGSSDITFEQDVGGPSKRIFLHTANKNGFELRLFSDQSPFTPRLGWTAYISSIVNS